MWKGRPAVVTFSKCKFLIVEMLTNVSVFYVHIPQLFQIALDLNFAFRD